MIAARVGDDDKSTTGDCKTEFKDSNNEPTFDPAGLDTEDVQPLRDGLFIASDEYGKVLIIDGEGVIHMTYIPHGAGDLITEVRKKVKAACIDGLTRQGAGNF